MLSFWYIKLIGFIFDLVLGVEGRGFLFLLDLCGLLTVDGLVEQPLNRLNSIISPTIKHNQNFRASLSS